MSDLYDTDIVTWTERQASLLRRLAAGERVNDQVDWENVAEEIESVGRNEIDAIEAWLFQASVHDLEAQAWPEARDVPAWPGEARVFRARARRKYRPSMRQRIDIAALYSDALRALPETLDGRLALALPQAPARSPWKTFSQGREPSG
ncbi:MAG: DUF29 family protein [Acetobacteraceae bacterium]